jgi:thiol-disulfide isomerase/thioredoxin
MRKSIILLLVVLIITACGQNKRFKIQGKLNNSLKGLIILKEMTTVDYIPVDSSKIDKSGDFQLTGNNFKPAFYILALSKNNYITLIIAPGERVFITGDARDLAHTYNVQGSKDSELAKELNDNVNNALKKIENLSKVYNDSLNYGNTKNIMALRNMILSKHDSIENQHRNYSISFIKSHPNSLASIMALYQELSPRRSLFNITDYYQLFSMVDSIMMKTYPEADAVQSLHFRMKDFNEQQIKLTETQKRLAIGALAPEIALRGSDGDTIKLSSTRGKYVLIDFWASWCGPCMQEIPNLVRIYWKYKNQGFDIYQVSLDKNKESWLKSITQNGLAWSNVSDFKMWNSPVVALYNIDEIPNNFLLDHNGKIIAKNLIGIDLANKMKEIFKY